MNLISLPLFCRATMPLIFMEKMSCLLAKNFITYVPVHFYFLKLIWTLLASSISHFLTAAVKFSCFSSNEVLLLCFQSLAQALIKNNAKKDSTLWLFFLSKSPSGHPISRQKYLELPVVSYMYQLIELI